MLNRLGRRQVVPLPDGHPLQCQEPGCKWQRRVVVPAPLCSRHLARYLRSTPPDVSLWLPEDDIVDEIAVETLTKGLRPGPLRATKQEYLLATANLLAQGPDKPVELVMNRMHISYVMAYQLIQEIKQQGIAEPAPVVLVSTANEEVA